MLLVVVSANFIGALILYGVSQYKGKAFVYRLRSSSLMTRYRYIDNFFPSVQDMEALFAWFRQKGDWLLFVCRFLPLIRSVISIPAGISGTPLFRFSVLSIAGMTIWDAGWLFIGRLIA
jgi:membrane protein DedA with SNARE-associated domain